MKMLKFLLLVFVITFVFAPTINNVQAQNGDQILDGIGETGIIARYVFDGDARDWSRNNLHAKVQGGEAKFVNEPSLVRSIVAFRG